MVWEANIFTEIERLLDELTRNFTRLERQYTSTRAEVHDAGDEYTIIIELPGFDKKDIHINADENSITIRAESTKEPLEGQTYSKRSYYETIRLPEEINPAKTRAKYRNGLLEITAPKKNPRKGFEVPIE